MQGNFLSIIVTPPGYKASGGVMAGMELSRSLAKLTPYQTALMSDKSEQEQESGGLIINRFHSETCLGIMGKIAPRPLQSVSIRSPALSDFISRTKPDLIHFHNPHPAGALWEFAQTCLNHNIPYVISSHGFVECADPSRWLGNQMIKSFAYSTLVRKAFIKTVNHAHAVLLTSPPEHTTADLLQIPNNKRFIVTNGFDRFFQEQASLSEKNQIQQLFKIDNQLPAFLFLGNHTANKGIDTLLSACHKAQADWRLIIGGAIRSTQEHDNLLNTYKVSELGNRVVFTDFLSREELRALYQSVDGFVFPSKADTLPLVVLDAMVAKLPVISTSVGGIPYQVDDSTGRLVDPGDCEALAQKLDELAASEELRKKLGTAGFHRVQERFNWDMSAHKALEVYQHVMMHQR